ncbi:hypothetical protein WNY39_17860 [Sulfitobacter sp. AS59]
MSSLLATKMLSFEEATTRALMRQALEDIGAQMKISPLEVADEDIDKLLRKRTNWKNKPSVALNLNSLSMSSKLARRIAKKAYAFACTRKIR